MKKYIMLLLALLFLIRNNLPAQPECYLQLYPDDNSKIIFQIKADRNYSDVAIYVNFYNSDGKAIKLNRKFNITSEANKYLVPDAGVYSFVFEHQYKDVDHIELGRILEKLAMLGFDRKRGTGQQSVDDGDLDHDQPYGREVNHVNVSEALGTIPPASTAIGSGNTNVPGTNGGQLIQIVEHHGILIHSSWSCDLHSGLQTTGGDFWWNVEDVTRATIVPKDGARFFLMWNCPLCYDTLSYAALTDYDRRGLMTADPTAIPIAHVPPGSLVAYRTKDGLYGVFKIEAYIKVKGIDLRFSSRTYGN